jgi:hypothetical protein
MFRYYNESRHSNAAFTMGSENPTGSEKATSASSDAKSVYRREIQNLDRLIRQLKTEQEYIAGLPVTDKETSEITDAIDSGTYVSKEIEIGVKIKNLEKKVESAKKRYQFLYGDKY